MFDRDNSITGMLQHVTAECQALRMQTSIELEFDQVKDMILEC